MQLAIFDVDGTLISGKSTEKRFMAWLLRHGFIGPRQIVAAVWFVLLRFPAYGRHVFRKNKAYLSGLPEHVVREQAARFVAALDESAWIGRSLAELRGHVERGDTVILMSGTLQPIIDALASRVGATSAIGTICHLLDGHYSGKPPLRHPFYGTKAQLLGEVRSDYGIGADAVAAYGDSRFDIPLFELVGTPVAVGPDHILAKWADAHACRIIEIS